jgi:steroid 5-alpha reductase family enzyme
LNLKAQLDDKIVPVMANEKRTQSFLTITLCYIAAAILGLWVFHAVSGQIWLKLLIADLAATVFIWLASLILDNASVYDPYWSVQPPIILGLALIVLGEPKAGPILLTLAIAFWGARLSINWMNTFHGLHKQDWRYDLLKAQSGQFFPLVNLIGIQVMPTLIVYACLLPGFYYILLGGGMNILTALGLLLIFGGAVLEMAADYQMQKFRQEREDRSELLCSGLWRYSRHPNYLGEITVWWGVYLVMLSEYPALWLLGFGALANTCLFLFISIPLAENHLAEYKQGYEAYQRNTRMLLPIPKQIGQEKQEVEKPV